MTFKPIGPVYDDGINWNAPFSEDRWELYHVESDPAEIHDLAEDHPDRLADMIDRWWVEARRNQVLPLDNRVLHTIINPKPDWRAPRLTTTYYPGGFAGPRAGGRQRQEPEPRHRGRRHRPARRAARGCCWPRARCSGASPSTCRHGCLRYVHNLYGKELHVVAATAPVAPGRHRLGLPASTGGTMAAARRSLTVDGAVVAEGQIPLFTVAAFSATGAGLTCGYELGSGGRGRLRGAVPLHGHHPHGHHYPE